MGDEDLVCGACEMRRKNGGVCFALNGALFTLIIFLSGVPQQKGVERTSSALESGVDCHFLACYAP